RELSTLPDNQVFGLGDADNFWQMGDTGPCGPSSEIFVDLEWQPGMPPATLSRAEFEAATEAGRFLEIWNLVFMQFDRSADGTLTPLPKPSVDTGAGLERITAVMQGRDDNFHTDLFMPLIEGVERVVDAPYPGGPAGTGISYRVLADHARAVAFLLIDGVYPSNEGRGFVLRRILRRAVRHAWLLGRRDPTLVELVPTVVELMGEAYPQLVEKQEYITGIVRREEERFLDTIGAGLTRLDAIFAEGMTTISGEESFQLFDTFGFPIDLTELIAAEHGVAVDIAGFDRAMTAQRERSRAARHRAGDDTSGVSVHVAGSAHDTSRFIGYTDLDAETAVLGADVEHGVLVLRDSPFYAMSGGQVADTGVVRGDDWEFDVTDVMKDSATGQRLVGHFRGEGAPWGTVTASVNAVRRNDIARNHSATHLAHLALRRALGDHVRQQGSLVEPGRLRFDFSHHGPVEAMQLAEIEDAINALVLANDAVDTEEMAYPDALARGAMAFFADKYGDLVRVVSIGNSIELCGGTHVRTAGEVGLFRFTAQGGVAAGVRRVEAVTGRGALDSVRAVEARLAALGSLLKTQPEHLERRIDALLAERDRLEARLQEALRGGATGEATDHQLGDVMLRVASTVAEDRGELGKVADEFIQSAAGDAILVLFSRAVPTALTVAVTPSLAARGRDANRLMKLLAERWNGRGGGKPGFASGSLAVASIEETVVPVLPAVVQEWLQAP
ncbi:MAG: alanine--tRNA ligase, partial [Gemmatimonadales bacterium]|nr:alanine--tRNA ligase [Gemmatimonadales bacterium]